MKLEQILTISARDYCDINAKQLSDYIAQGIHVFIQLYFHHEYVLPAKEFLKSAPQDTEVVVGYSICKLAERSYGEICYLEVNGTALIPKQKGE